MKTILFKTNLFEVSGDNDDADPAVHVHGLLLGRVPRAVASLNQHILTSEDVVSCCLDLGAPSISFRINGQPVQGMFENFNTDGLFFPVVSFSAGVK